MNDSRTPDPKKEVCDELAELLHSGEGRRLARLMQLVALTEGAVSEPASPPPPASPPDEPRAISIYRPRRRDGAWCFERPAPLPLGDHHAARRVIAAEKPPSTLRVAYFGESAAAGYLYAPHLTPAQILEQQLGHHLDGDVEVVDLARTNESLAPLIRTVEASLQLDPDLLVIFVGNNWNLLETPEASPHAPSIRARQRYALALRQGGIGGAVERARRQLELEARGALQQLAALAAGRELVLVIPESNLLDWHNRQPVPWLEGEATGSWYRLHDEAVAALERGDATAAHALAREMLDLDGGVCPTSHRLLGRALFAQRRFSEARRAFQAEVDANAYASLAFLGAPQVTTQVRRLLLDAARDHGWTTVDLRSVIARHSENGLPGRRFFLDYCHLSLEGMRLAMAAVAAAILARRDRAVVGAEILEQVSAPELCRQHQALAHLGAALHTAHRMVGEKRELLEDACRTALSLSPPIAETMRDLVVARCSGVPAVLTTAQQRNLASPYRLLLQHGWRWEGLDADVLLAIRKVMAETGQPIAEEMDRLLLERHRAAEHPARGVELSRLAFLWEPLERLFPEVMEAADQTTRAYYRALWPRSSFCLICTGDSDVELEIVARLPGLGRTGEPERVGLSVNGGPQTDLALTTIWSRTALRLAASGLERGLNRLTLHWPPPRPVGEEALRQAVERLEEGLEADLHPLFGEIFALRARA